MGRYSTGVSKTASVCRVEMKDFTRWKIFKYPEYSFSMNWTDGSSMNVTLYNKSEDSYFIFQYVLTDNSGKSYDLKYKVFITKVPSNLGRGFIYYFICPSSGRMCRILYRAYGSHTFKSREAYKYKLYYPMQTESKKYRIFDKRNNAEEKLLKLSEGRKRNQEFFKGKRTKYSIKREIYLNRFIQLDEESSAYLLANLCK